MKILLIISTILFSCLPTLCFGSGFGFLSDFQNNPDEEFAHRTSEELSRRSSEAQHALPRQQRELTLPSPQENSPAGGISIPTSGDVRIPIPELIPTEVLQEHIVPRLTPGDLSALASTSSYLRNSRVMARTHGMTSIDFSLLSHPTEEQIITGLRSHLLLDIETHSFIPNTSITELDLSNQRITREILEFIAKYFPNLKSLKLRGIIANNIQEIIDHLKAILTNNRLQDLNHLDFSNNRIGPAGARTLAAALRNIHLTSLDLSNNKIGAAGAAAIAAALTHLTSLNLSNTRIGDVGAEAIAAALTHLTYLDLSWNRIGAAGAEAIAASLINLMYLNLSCNRIGDTGAEAIAASLINLMYLNLSWNRIGDTGAKAIAASLINLIILNLSCNRIGDTGVQALAKLTNLTHLFLSWSEFFGGNNITPAVKQQISEQFPNKIIEF